MMMIDNHNNDDNNDNDILIKGAKELSHYINKETSFHVAIDAKSIVDACYSIAKYTNRTPVMTSSFCDTKSGNSLFFKCEPFQKTGAFKFRGAMNAVLHYKADHYVTESSGNHGQALALAAKLTSSRATVVAPFGAPEVKIQAMKDYGAKVIQVKPEERTRETQKIIDAVLVHPSDDIYVLNGQATVAVEFWSQVKDLDVIVTAVGGGGLLGGVAVAAKYLFPNIYVIGAEPKNADDAYRSKTSGTLQGHPGGIVPVTVADGLRTTLGPNTWPIVRDVVDEIITVDEEEILSARTIIMQRMKVVVEANAAVPLAAVFSSSFRFRNKRVGIVLSGGNTVIPA